jgi:type VI secretion system protein ImpJ
MTPRPVHWHEGMFLRPHHFQAAERHAARLLADNVALVRSHAWGLGRCVIDPEALGGFRLVVRGLDARFRDGTTISLPDDAPAPDLDLKPAFADRTSLDVYIAIPKWRPGQPNLHTATATAPARFTAAPLPVDDENTGVNPQPVQFRAPNVRVLLGDEDRSGYESLSICRLEKSERAEATPKLATGFIPPVLACDAWPALQNDILQQVFFRLNKKIEVLAAQVTSRGISFDSHSPGDAKRMQQLSRMNEGHSVLSHVAFTPGVHPADAYLELCRIVGQLSVFGAEARPPELPRYDHDDLGGCFWKVKQYIDALLGDVEEPAYQERPFIGTGLRMQVALESAWLEAGWQMFLGVRAGVTSEECVKMLTRPERLGMKIGSSDRVDTIFTRGQEGLKFTPAPRPPRDLPAPAAGPPSQTYFEVSRESSTNEWAHVVKAKTLAIRVAEQDVVGSIDGQRTLTIRTGGQTNTFTFTLYLVPTTR